MFGPPAVPQIHTFPDIIDPLMPHGSMSTLSGASGVGKTAFLAGIIKTLQDGGQLWDLPTICPPAIGYLACDRPWRDHAKWFAKAGCKEFPHYSLRDTPYKWEELRVAANVPGLFGALLDALGLPPGALVIVDPIALFLPGRLHDYKDMAIAMGLLDVQLKARQLTCLGIFHVAKQKANEQDQYARPQDRILGSGALLGYSETAFYLLDPTDTGKKGIYEFGMISHQSKPLAFQYVRDANGLFTPADYFDRLAEEERALSFVPLDGSIIQKSVWLHQVTAALHMSQRTAERLMADLVHTGRVQRSGNGKYQRARSTQPQ